MRRADDQNFSLSQGDIASDLEADAAEFAALLEAGRFHREVALGEPPVQQAHEPADHAADDAGHQADVTHPARGADSGCATSFGSRRTLRTSPGRTS